jgi:predicted RNase H-like HicB family nuclease
LANDLLRKLQKLTPAERLDRNSRLAELAEQLLATVIIEKNPDGYVARTEGIKGVVVGQGDTCEEALADVESAVLFHVGTFGIEVLHSSEPTSPSLDLQRAPGGGDGV